MAQTLVITTKMLQHYTLEHSNCVKEMVTHAINEMDRELLEQINPSGWQLESIETRIYPSKHFPTTMIERNYTLCLRK